MFQQVKDQLCYDKPIVQITNQLNPSPMSLIRQQREHPDEDLGSCGKAALTESMNWKTFHSRLCKGMIENPGGWESERKCFSG